MSKQAQANAIYAAYAGTDATRKSLINIIVNELGVSQAHASTLYYNAKKKSGPSAPATKDRALQQYIDDANAWGKIFPNHVEIKYPTNRQECKPLFEKLACDLSPENLCCDGELPAAQVRRKARHLHACWAALETIFGRKVDEGETYSWR